MYSPCIYDDVIWLEDINNKYFIQILAPNQIKWLHRCTWVWFRTTNDWGWYSKWGLYHNHWYYIYIYIYIYTGVKYWLVSFCLAPRFMHDNSWVVCRTFYEIKVPSGDVLTRLVVYHHPRPIPLLNIIPVNPPPPPTRIRVNCQINDLSP